MSTPVDKLLPPPLVPAEVDLRGYEFMPYYGDRLRDSDLNSRATDAEYRAAHNLWWAAWKQVPAASLPDDDVVLARLADLGRDVKAWRKVRDVSLRGFVKCSDGRLYHQVLAEVAMESWEHRKVMRSKTEAARQARLSQRLSQKNNSLSQTGKASVEASVTDSTAILQGQDSNRTAAAKVVDNSTSGAVNERKGAAAADQYFYPEKLPHALQENAVQVLNGTPHAQMILDELAGAMEGGKVRDPMAMLISLVRQAQEGKLAYSHAPRIQVARELAQAEAQLATDGRTREGLRVA